MVKMLFMVNVFVIYGKYIWFMVNVFVIYGKYIWFMVNVFVIYGKYIWFMVNVFVIYGIVISGRCFCYIWFMCMFVVYVKCACYFWKWKMLAKQSKYSSLSFIRLSRRQWKSCIIKGVVYL
jgi:hypothetical protein